MNLSPADLRELPDAAVSGRRLAPKMRFAGVSTDSRTVKKGDVFIALRGEKFDGHEFVADAAGSGAGAVVVDSAFSIPSTLRRRAMVVVVPDTTKALGDLALLYRMKFDLPIIAVGGSNGKTTTKEMITAVLREKYTVLATEGNLNNHIGVPQMLLRLRPSHELCVLELGTNHFGELKYLCSIALPTHAVVTNIGREHLEFFGTLDGVAEEETELFRFMAASSGRAFINADDRYLAHAAEGLDDTITFGRASTARFHAAHVEIDQAGCASFDCAVGRTAKPRRFRLGASGVHNVSNALAAIAVGASFGVTPVSIARALKRFTSASKRMEIIRRNGVTILNDTYNANPDSMLAALTTLMSIESDGKTIAVLGDMFELGERSEEEHRSIGRALHAMKPGLLVTVGRLARQIHAEARLSASHHCETKDEALSILRASVAPGDTVLVKGSRGMAMETIAAQL